MTRREALIATGALVAPPIPLTENAPIKVLMKWSPGAWVHSRMSRFAQGDMLAFTENGVWVYGRVQQTPSRNADGIWETTLLVLPADDLPPGVARLL